MIAQQRNPEPDEDGSIPAAAQRILKFGIAVEELLHGDTWWLAGPVAVVAASGNLGSGITSEAEEQELEALNDWVEQQGLPRGELAFDFADAETGEPLAVFELVWPCGLQVELSQPAAVLLNESNDTLAIASRAGFRCFTTDNVFNCFRWHT